ncbi:unnamed protein product [Thlaspi arvense]|uniref:Lysosomal Pro-X carboxypeptidase n=1 Tax=Thlaspi arvense TaxID=13288 RepID=A0AAU9RIZ4_THLAR|nr:unnamed protein product [Thlaspi arvense]
MNSSTPTHSLKLLPFSLLFLLGIVSAAPHNIPRLTAIRGKQFKQASNTILAYNSEDFKTFFHNQTLDHFNFRPDSYAIFQQRYMINDKYWGGAEANAPIFVYLGAENPLDDDFNVIGFLADNAPYFKALQVYIEHRYYGQSVPFGSIEEVMKNEDTRGYFSSAQAIADYAEVILHLKGTLSAQSCPVIVVGASYGGMLASWFRLKYPHVALGALASSAPILYFDDITPQNGYYSLSARISSALVFVNDGVLQEASESCYKTIQESWSEIDRVASQPNGLSILSQKFRTCSPLNNSSDLKDYLESIYTYAAQYNDPSTNPVSNICAGIDGAGQGTDVLSRIFTGLDAYYQDSCYNLNPSGTTSRSYFNGWGWQRCSEMVMPIGRSDNTTMFPPEPFDLDSYVKRCVSLYGVSPRPHWVTTYYGGHDIKLVLRRFASNIIFSNGLKDPYSSGG